ncbi:MAG: 16S rRNA (cytosine(1402)-N(4))-methyltransferase RsmH [Planctomycetota bacterium]|nr:16S rRNA (cytosine(1402)-N(4))-methyltransferase RsmH [Planctomycetota bacterium]
MNPGSVHRPVLVDGVLSCLEVAFQSHPEGWMVDGTLGAGGHTAFVLEQFPGARVLGCDQDSDMQGIAKERLAEFGERVAYAHSRFSDLQERLRDDAEFPAPFDGLPVAMLFDVGVASPHLDIPERGFSFQADGPLDMRMDVRREVTAAEIINKWPEVELANLFYEEGGERRSRAIAKRLVEVRRRAAIVRTATLADFVAGVVGGGGGKIHPATRVFQALRREVNQEGPELQAALEASLDFLPEGGVLAIISFHSGEDRVVKQWLSKEIAAGNFGKITKKPIQATYEETRSNPRARSAKLRAAVRRREGGAL